MTTSADINSDQWKCVRPGLLDATYRANPAYQLIVFDRLGPEEQISLASLKIDPKLYGILRPRRPGLTIKVIDRDTALLFFALTDPGLLPFYFIRVAGDNPEETVARLVFGEVLEIGCDGAFLSGINAAKTIFADAVAEVDNCVNSLSTAAIRYGYALGLDDPVELSGRLYRFNTEPHCQRTLQDISVRGVDRFLGIDAGGSVARSLSATWDRHDSADGTWVQWLRRDHLIDFSAPSYKLYLSARAVHLPAALIRIASSPLMVLPYALKVGHDRRALLRPDKLVVYFASKAALLNAVDALEPEVRDLGVQGVPFAGSLGAAGLLSWGMDPPRGTAAGPWLGPSWRRWLTDLVAAILVRVRDVPIEAALQLVRGQCMLAGVDPTNWAPAVDIWHRWPADKLEI